MPQSIGNIRDIAEIIDSKDCGKIIKLIETLKAIINKQN